MERRLAAILAADMAGYSRLMEQDEDGVLARQKHHRRSLIDPAVAERGGRIVKSTGDGLLVEFASAQDAVRCATEIQSQMAVEERDSPSDRRIAYRIGINLGDVVFEEGDIFGDGVNIAARLEGIAEPGGICISGGVHETVAEHVRQGFRDMGRQRVKNISRPIRVWQWTPSPGAEPKLSAAAQQQRVRFAIAPDGVQLAWASLGEGLPVLKAPHWMNHLEYEWRSPLFAPLYSELANHFQLVRFDQRGNGLSDWDAQEINEDAMAGDIAAVADAAGLKRFALLGFSQGAAFAIRYANENPERVACLVLVGGYLRGRMRRPDPEQKQLYEALTLTIRDGWGSPNPVFRHFFTSSFIPDSGAENASSFDELQRIATSPQNAIRIWEMNAQIDASEEARRVSVPTLVLHCQGDRVAPIDEGQRAARLIPGAAFVELPGNNHILLDGTPAFDRFFEELVAFVSEHLEAAPA
ncbi:MAG: alpha/beta fold hydrolase [Rhodovibrionaceae bacterium]